MVDERGKEARTSIATAKLEGLVSDNVLFEKYTKVVEDPSVIRFKATVDMVWQTDDNGDDANWLGYTVHIESKTRVVSLTGPRKDWRNTLDKALTLWIEDAITDIDPL